MPKCSISDRFKNGMLPPKYVIVITIKVAQYSYYISTYVVRLLLIVSMYACIYKTVDTVTLLYVCMCLAIYMHVHGSPLAVEI